MKFSKPHTLKQIADLINCKYTGSSDFPVLGMNEIHVVEPGDIVFVDHPKYYGKALESAATIVLINKDVECPEGKALLISDDPFRDFNKLTDYFNPFKPSNSAIAKSATIGKNTIIQPNCFIGNNVIIGDDCEIHSNVSIYDDTIIGNNVTIHAGTVLGANAFYYKNRPEGYDRLKSGGRVVIEDNVDIGAACTIDRGVTADTTIGKGSKLDNQIQIGHDTIVGEKCLIASQTGIAGCVVIENNVIIWGQVGVKSGITIAEGTEIYAQSGLGHSTEKGKSYFGSPASEARERFKEMAYIRKIPEILKSLKS
ncbi:UDP-3-O-(3-hydroxymyristoyl)glucosamine N-acyltransferase [Algibacter mikhailovii]|uniref:UDP-3-O-(3-hydroxymyristoyl)glucosamine N-acyltransferase n=1 Tax=Algibacter mikhailovii TaxID=425498 RepID=A0A918V478_9FLAO|nr:UDP-3-O-(3-hydroxymyristoyl)glucosamine N-acyltransferase [Algibacter mikhailovii]GGZ69319.1 UDP-3-O-(3-hydroxymyristoyl)glucosamine N-acyltransferase [Algibacter mikhailovii]